MALKPSLALLAIASLCALPACGDDDDSSAGGGGSSGAAAETQAVTFTTTEPAKNRVAIDGPSSIDAGLVDITLKNSAKAPHDAQLVRVAGDQTAKQVISDVIDTEEGAPTPDWAHGAGGVGSVDGGASATVTQVLLPGTYYLVDTESSEGEGEGQPNARRGGIVKLEVAGDEGGELPATDATITADEYSFESTGVKPGKNRLTFENAGNELHHVIAFPMRKGAKFSEVTKLFASEREPKGPPPVDFERFESTAVLDGGEEQVTEMDFARGKYALVCFVADRAGGPPHVAKGMISELDVR
jgi:hypothetical protein